MQAKLCRLNVALQLQLFVACRQEETLCHQLLSIHGSDRTKPCFMEHHQALFRCVRILALSTQELFLDWLKHFQVSVKSSPEDPVLLLVDNHSSHISLPAVQYCRQHAIHAASLPPHSSHSHSHLMCASMAR